MLVFLDTTGAVTATAPSTTGRNSAAMSTIYIVAPISGAATLSLSFRLPNGDEVNPALADTVHNAVEILKGVPLPDNQRVWSYAIPASVTRIAGTVTYTITTHTESMTGTGSGTFVVAPATTKTAPSAPTDDDAWADLLAKLSEIYAVEETILGNDPVTKLDGTTLTTVTALLADLVELIGKDGAESPIGGSTTITTLLAWAKDEVIRLSAALGSGSIPFAATLTEAINALNEMKVSKTSEPSAVYGTDGNGNTTAIPYSVGVKYDGPGNATSIPLRDNSGHVKTADPIAVDDAVSLGYYNREVGAITDGLRGLDNIVKGRSRALVFDNWEDALVAITSKGTEDLQIGDAVLIRDLGAPDAWISGISPNYDPYPGGIGVTNPFGDNALTFVVGWYAISPLESPKVNLDEYAKEDDLARLKKEVANLRANIPPEYFITDAAVAYAKTVPADALPFAEVQEVGGMTRRSLNLWTLGNVSGTQGKILQVDYPAGTYTFGYVATSEDTNKTECRLLVRTEDGGSYTFYPKRGWRTVSTFTAASRITLVEMDASSSWADAEGDAFSFTDIMLNEGDVALPFEPYYEGIRSAPVTALESVGTNLLDLTLALNARLTDNGDGTYTLRNINGSRFSADFPLYIPAGSIVNCSFDIVDTNVEGLKSISVRIKDRPGNVSFLLTDGGQDFGITAGGSVADIYFPPNSSDGDYVTFRNPMIKLDYGYVGYKPYIKRTYPIPAEVQDLEGWGLGVNETYHNRLLWAEKKYRQEVARYVFTGDNLTNWEDSNRSFVGLYLDNVIPYLSDTGNDIRAVCNDFTVYARVPVEGERGIGLRQTGGINRLYIRDDSFSSAADFKAYFAEKYASGNPVTIDYVLASPIVTDLPDLPADNYIEVEGGGMITAVNEHGLAAPTKIEYQLKEATA